MSEISESNRILAKTLSALFGTKPQVTRYWDESNKFYIDILLCENSPNINICSYGTIGVSDQPLINKGKDIGFRVELVAAGGAQFSEMANILSTVAFCVIKDQWLCASGALFPDVIKMYRSNSQMKHIMLTTPFLWTNLKTIDLKDKKVVWLMLIPISEKEYQFAEQNGSNALENIFKEKQLDLFDLDRASII